MRTYFLLLLTACVLLGASCASQPAASPESAHPDYNLVATIKDIMDSAVDPSADYIWESVGTEISAAGTIVKAPKTADDWKEERRRAILLVEAANLLVMPGRKVAKPGEKSENPGIELGPEEIQALIDADVKSFQELAFKFQQVAIEQLKAVDDKNLDDLLKTGGDIDAACEACHRKYWYPNEPIIQDTVPATVQPVETGEKAKTK